MYLKVRANPGAGKNSIEKKGDRFIVSVKAKPKGGEANEIILQLLAGYLGVETKRLRIIKGAKEKSKIIEMA